jgi:hypothetical protein
MAPVKDEQKPRPIHKANVNYTVKSRFLLGVLQIRAESRAALGVSCCRSIFHRLPKSKLRWPMKRGCPTMVAADVRAQQRDDGYQHPNQVLVLVERS